MEQEPMNAILPTKKQLDQRDMFRARFDNITKNGSPTLLATVDPKIPPPVVETAMKTIDNLLVGLGPRLMLAMMADTMMGLQVNAPPAQGEEAQIELGAWNRALYMLANSQTQYLDMAQDFELRRSVAMRDTADPVQNAEQKQKTES